MKKRGQVWVETVVYTLVALVLIGLVLTFIKPKITELQDKAIVQQSITMLENINSVMLGLSEGGAGNKREVDLNVKAGSLTIDGQNNKITFTMDSSYQFSESGIPVNYGDVTVYDEVFNNLNIINMTLDYSSLYNITYQKRDAKQTLTQSSTPYKIFISNNGITGGGTNPNMDFEQG